MSFIATINSEFGAKVRWISGLKEHILWLYNLFQCALHPHNTKGLKMCKPACIQYVQIPKNAHSSLHNKFRILQFLLLHGTLCTNQNILYFHPPQLLSIFLLHFFLYFPARVISPFLSLNTCFFSLPYKSHSSSQHATVNNISVIHGWQKTECVGCAHVNECTDVLRIGVLK